MTQPTAQAIGNGAATDVQIRWDDADIASKYANVATATATREEFFLLFGTHQSWRGMEPGMEFKVKLSDRIVLNPFAAKRLLKILEATLAAYERRYGEVKI